MRILFLVHRVPYPPNKGEKIRALWELRTLSERHQVDLFCFYDDPEDARHFDALRPYCCEFYAEPLPWLRSRAKALLAAAMGRSFTRAFFCSSQMARRVRGALNSRHHDLVFVYSSSMAQYAEDVSAPVVVDLVDMDSDKWEQYAARARAPQSWLWRQEARRLGEYESQLVDQCASVLLCTDAEADLLRNKKKSADIRALWHPVDTAYFDPAAVQVTPEIRRWQPYLIFSGSMDYLPNVDAVTHFYREVFGRIREAVPQLRFVIAGRSPAREVRELARDQGVHVTGSVADVRPWLRGASAAVCPMRMARGVQNKLLEAVAMGVPVATNTKTAAALPPAIRSQLVIEDEPQLLAEAVAALIRKGRASARQSLIDVLGPEAARQHLHQLVSEVAGARAVHQV